MHSGSRVDVQKGNIGSFWPKSEENEDNDDYTYQDPTDRWLGGWSHDQILNIDQKRKL